MDVILQAVLKLFFGIVWVLYLVLNCYISIVDKTISFPRQYEIGAKQVFMGFLFALFKRKESINISDIKHIDIIPGYNGKNIETLHQPMIITLKNETKKSFKMKYFAKRTVINILKALKRINPQIKFSDSCKMLLVE